MEKTTKIKMIFRLPKETAIAIKVKAAQEETTLQKIYETATQKFLNN